MLFGMFIAILNQTLLNVALPKINTEFNISASTGQWLMTGFMLVNGILIPISAFLFNKYSYRRLFIIALVLFTLGSLVCAISTNFPIMMTGRVLQAIGAGVLMPLGSNVIVTIFPPEKRGADNGYNGYCHDSCASNWPNIIWLYRSKLPLERNVLWYDCIRYPCYHRWFLLVQTLQKQLILEQTIKVLYTVLLVLVLYYMDSVKLVTKVGAQVKSSLCSLLVRSSL